MKSRRSFSILAGGVLVAAGLLLWGEHGARASDALRQAIAREAAAQQRLRAELSAAQKRLVVPMSNAPAARTAEPSALPTSKTPPRERPPILANVASENPQMWNDFLSLKRIEYRRGYAAYFRRAGLRQEHCERVLDILIQGLAASVDIGAAVAAKNMSSDDPLAEELQKDAESQTEATLAEYLGPAHYGELERFRRTLQVRGFVDGLAVQLAEIAPLTTQQADRLEEVIAAASPEFRAGRHAQPQTLEWAEIDRQARDVLTPQQLALWLRGSAHNTASGSRRALELSAAYWRAIEKAKAQGGG